MISPALFPADRVRQLLEPASFYSNYNRPDPRNEDFFWFEPIDLQTFQCLIDAGAVDPSDKQNLAPSIGEILDWARGYEFGDIKLGGYAVLPPRTDTRISIDTVLVSGRHDMIPETWAAAAAADGEDWIEPNGYRRLWWD